MQKIKVNVVMANRNSRKLIFSMRPRENEEEVEKKRNLMAKLRVGDVVKCCIKKITYFGIFCEVCSTFLANRPSRTESRLLLKPKCFVETARRCPCIDSPIRSFMGCHFRPCFIFQNRPGNIMK